MRKFIFISSGILFLLVAAGLVIIGSGDSDNMLIMLSGAAVPFLFSAYWNLYSVYFEGKTNSSGEYFTYKGTGTAGIGAFYNKVIVVPFFLILLGSIAFAIITAILASSRATEDISVAILCASVLYSLLLTIYFTFKIGREFKNVENVQKESSADELGFKIAFFFASIATLGVFPLVYFMIKLAMKKKQH